MHGTNGSGLLDWNDARIFLAVARHGSLRAAGRALGISQPTIGRRVGRSVSNVLYRQLVRTPTANRNHA